VVYEKKKTRVLALVSFMSDLAGMNVAGPYYTRLLVFLHNYLLWSLVLLINS